MSWSEDMELPRPFVLLVGTGAEIGLMSWRSSEREGVMIGKMCWDQVWRVLNALNSEWKDLAINHKQWASLKGLGHSWGVCGGWFMILLQGVIWRDSRLERGWLGLVVTVQERGKVCHLSSYEDQEDPPKNFFRVYDFSEVSLNMQNTNVLRWRDCQLQGTNWQHKCHQSARRHWWTVGPRENWRIPMAGDISMWNCCILCQPGLHLPGCFLSFDLEGGH